VILIGSSKGMTGRELVTRAVTFDGPERVPGSLPDPWCNDILRVRPGPDPGWKPSVEGEDEFGCIWKKVSPEDRSKGQVKVHPLADWENLEDLRFPDYTIPERYSHMPGEIENNSEDKFVMASIPLSLIHRLRYLRGNRAAMVDPYMNRDRLEHLLDHLTQIALDSLEQIRDLGIDGIVSADDWGLQDRSFMSPEIFEKFFKERYAKVYGRAHEYGMLTFLHSCGHISELLDHFIDANLDVIQMDQQENMGIENLADEFGGRISFWCPVDIQNTMVKGSPSEVASYARRLIGTLGAFDGGFISKYYGGGEVINHPDENVQAMFRAFKKYGRYHPG